MSFAQPALRKKLAVIEVRLSLRSEQLYQLGFRSTVAHNPQADASEPRGWHIHDDLPQVRICRARRLYAEQPLSFELDSDKRVKTQKWIAVRTYVLVAIARKELPMEVRLF